MKFNKWTLGLAAVGVVSLASAARADEKMNALQTALSNTTISGYVDVSAQWNLSQQRGFYGIGGGSTPGYSYGGINKADGFNLNAVDIAFDKPQDESPWAAGYHIEFMFGPDNPAKLGIGSVAINSAVNTSPILNQLLGPSGNLRQAYVVLRTPIGNGIDWKIGVFDTIIGYESTSDPLNPNFTRSYGYSIEPTTHTGILASYKINDIITIQAGIADSSNVGTLVQPINGRVAYETQKTYMGSIALTAPDSMGFMKGATLNVGVIDSLDSDVHGGGLTPGSTSIYAGATIPTPMTALKLGMAFDYVDLHNGGVPSPGVNGADDSAWNIALYGAYQATDKLSFNLRGEYLKDGTGLLYTQVPVGAGATANTAEELTATIEYNLWANVISRVEFRWDHVETGNAFDSSTGSFIPTNDHANAYMIALNLIYQF